MKREQFIFILAPENNEPDMDLGEKHGSTSIVMFHSKAGQSLIGERQWFFLPNL